MKKLSESKGFWNSKVGKVVKWSWIAASLVWTLVLLPACKLDKNMANVNIDGYTTEELKDAFMVMAPDTDPNTVFDIWESITKMEYTGNK